MTANPFTAFVFDATGETQSPNTRTLPDRLAEIKNVKDFGAVGDGVTDDWAAIMAAFNWGQVTLTVSGTPSGNVVPFASVPAGIIVGEMYAADITTPSAIPNDGGKVQAVSPTTITLENAGSIASGDTITVNWILKGRIYFPPGMYLVSQPLKFYALEDSEISAVYLGELGASTIKGNFADYVIIQAASQTSSSLTIIEKLNIVNSNAAGGGIRFGSTAPGAIRDCTVTAWRGISDYGGDVGTFGYFGSLDITFENCSVSPPTANASGSIGIMKQSDGPVTNCKVIGYENGFINASNEGAQFLTGCYFEKCNIAVNSNLGPDGGSKASSGLVLAGCWFKNNSIAINMNGSTGIAKFVGLRIEGTNGQAPGGTNPLYGIKDGDGGSGGFVGSSLFAGIVITGQYDAAGISLNTANGARNTTYIGVACTNSGSGVAWSFFTVGSNPFLPNFIACSGVNQPHIYTVAGLAAINVGECYNVSDGTNGLAWGATVTNTGTHTTHYKTRYNGSNFTVVGQ